MKTSFSSMVVKIAVLKVFKSTCNLRVSLNGNNYVFLEGVKLNALCRHHLLNPDNENVRIDVEYSSENNSLEYINNPFRLTKYRDKNTGEIEYYLSLVNVSKSIKTAVNDPLMGRGIAYTQMKLKRVDYYRYVDTTNSAFRPNAVTYKDDPVFVPYDSLTPLDKEWYDSQVVNELEVIE